MTTCDHCNTQTDERALAARFGLLICTQCDHGFSDAEFIIDCGLDCVVCLSPWEWHGSDQEYSESDSPDGWNVYVRVETPKDRIQPFDIIADSDFSTYDAAMSHATQLAKEYGNVEIQEY